MALDLLRKKSRRVIGVKQVTKAVNKGTAEAVFIASDAENWVVEPLRKLCAEKGVHLDQTETLKTLGQACSIEVGAAAVAVLTEA